MTDDIRWALFVVAGAGVVMNAIMLHRLNSDIREARDLGLIDCERSLAIRARRRQSVGLLVIAGCMALSALFDAGSGVARLLVFFAALVIDWKSWRLYGDRFNADVMAAERLRREREDTEE